MAQDPGTEDPGEEPRWLLYRCVACRQRLYSGYTSSALERLLAADSLVKPDFFHADCATETPLAEADLRYDDDTPWTPPGPAP